MAIALYTNAVRLFDTAAGKEIATLPHPQEVGALAFAPDGKRLATACWDRAIRIWDLARARGEKRPGRVHKDRVTAVDFAANGKWLLCAGGGDGHKLGDAGTGKDLHTFRHSSFFVASATFSRDGGWGDHRGL